MSLSEAESLFSKICQSQNVDGDIEREALALLQRFYEHQGTTSSEYTIFWPICAIYVVSCNAAETRAAGIPLSPLLRHADKTIFAFFEHLTRFCEVLSLPLSIVENLRKKFLMSSLLFGKYEQIFAKLFDVEQGRPPSIGKRRNDVDVGDLLFSFCWNFFLVAKAKLQPSTSDFAASLHLLMACINLALYHAPSRLLRVKLADLIAFVDSKVPIGDSGEFYPGDSLLYLAVINSANYELLKDVQQRILNPWVKTLCQNGILKFEPAKVAEDPSLVNEMYLGELLESFLAVNEKALKTEYELILYVSADFDERLFLEHNEQLQSPFKRPSTENVSHIPSVVPGLSIPAVVTPARAALATTDWLHRTIDVLKLDEISPHLMKFIVLSWPNESNAENHVVEKVDQLLAALQIPSSYENRQNQIKKLFYRLLEQVLVTETARLTYKSEQPEDSWGRVVVPLLKHDMFRASLLACCTEIVLFSAHIQDDRFRFPSSLEVMKIPPYELTKVIETIVKVEKTLPRSVVKHLVRIEERVLEELGWVESSPLWASLSSSKKPEEKPFTEERFAQIQDATGSPKKPKTHALQLLASPSKLPLSPVRSTPPPPSPTRVTIQTALTTQPPTKLSSGELFLRKVAHLASLRIRELISELVTAKIPINTNMTKQIEHMMSYVLTQKTSLFKDRHLDQIIIAVLYGILKVNRMDKSSFKLIVDKYLNQPQADTKIYRQVLLNNGETGDIIQFYNNIFLPQLESVLLQYEVDGTVNDVADLELPETKFAFVSPKPNRSPQKISTLLVSPRRTPLLFHNRHQAAAHTANLGAIDFLSPRQTLERINAAIQGPAHPGLSSPSLKNSARKKLDFDDEPSTPTTTKRGRTIRPKRPLDEDFSDDSSSHKAKKLKF